MREVTLNEICKQKVIAIVRGLNKDEAVKAAKALYEAEINVLGLDQTLRQVNIQFMVASDCFEKALKALHHEFVEKNHTK